jgi:hypothetical protein
MILYLHYRRSKYKDYLADFFYILNILILFRNYNILNIYKTNEINGIY